MSEQSYFNLTPDPKVLIALTHTHIIPIDALCELIDNAIDSFSAAKLQGIKIDSPTVRVDLPKTADIEQNKGVIRISDNGPGLTSESAEKALKAGFSGNNPYDTLGLFGMGFNISTGKMGSVTHFFSARQENDLGIDVTIDLNEINEKKDYRVLANRTPKGDFSHGTIIEVYNWWPEGNPNRSFIRSLIGYGAKKIREVVGRRYATILRKGEIKIFINEVACEAFEHCVWGDNRYVERKKHGKIPAVYRFNEVIYTQKKCMHCTTTLSNSQTICPSCGSQEIRTVEERISGWVGIQRFDDLQEYGIDLIRNGRAIRISEKSAFFEFTDDFQNTIKDYPIDSNYGRIIGEVELNHVPVDFMKQDFQRSSQEWYRAIAYLRGNSSLQPTQQGADQNDSPIFKLFQGYRKVKTPGKTDMYMGTWDSVREEPVRISRDVEKEFYERFKKKEPGYYDDAEWWKKVEEADQKPIKKLPLCPNCGCQNLEEAEICIGCQAVLRGKNCISCNELIPMSAKVCPKCGTNQEAEVLKPWVCNVCGAKNDAALSECSNCASKKGTENHLSKDYLLKNSDKSDYYSIKSLTIDLVNGMVTQPINVDVYITRDHIHSNIDDNNIPLVTENDDFNNMVIFIDNTHRIFKNCKIKIEQMIASEVAKYILLMNPISDKSKRHTLSYVSWQIINKCWSDKLELNNNELVSAINDLLNTVREKLILSGNSDLEDKDELMTKEETSDMVNSILNAGKSISDLPKMKQNLEYLKYVPASFLVKLFTLKPELFFDGIVWSEPYVSIPMSTEIRAFSQSRTKSLYEGCLNDLLYFLTYKDTSSYVLERTIIAVQLLKQKVVE